MVQTTGESPLRLSAQGGCGFIGSAHQGDEKNPGPTCCATSRKRSEFRRVGVATLIPHDCGTGGVGCRCARTQTQVSFSFSYFFFDFHFAPARCELAISGLPRAMSFHDNPASPGSNPESRCCHSVFILGNSTILRMMSWSQARFLQNSAIPWGGARSQVKPVCVLRALVYRNGHGRILEV